MTGGCDDQLELKDPFTPEAVDRAVARCMRRKRGRPDAIGFRMRQGEEVLALVRRLRAGQYVPQPGKVFVTQRPKHREIHAAPFRDRVVHHLLYDVLEPRFESVFIGDSFACRKGKGTHAAVHRLRQMMRNVTRHGEVLAYALQMDIKSFFMSIHKPTLLAMLQKVFTQQELSAPVGQGVWHLTKTVVMHDPTVGARRCGPPAVFARVPAHKRLGAAGPDAGLPIGNLTSQFFANVYLNALDQHVKRTLGVKHYVRYVDDFVLLASTREQLTQWEGQIRVFLRERLRLEAHPARMVPTSQGIDFLGYIIRPGYALVRARVVHGFQERVAALEAGLGPVHVAAGKAVVLKPLGRLPGPLSWRRLDEQASEALRATWASLEAHLRHANAHRLWEALWAAHPISAAVLGRVGSRVFRQFALTKAAASFSQQVRQLNHGVNGALVVQVGKYAEVPMGPAARKLGLRWSARRAGRRRGVAGVPWIAVGGLVRRALDQGVGVVVALEQPQQAGNVKARRVAYFFGPLAGQVAAPQNVLPKAMSCVLSLPMTPRVEANGQMCLPGILVVLLAGPGGRPSQGGK